MMYKIHKCNYPSPPGVGKNNALNTAFFVPETKYPKDYKSLFLFKQLGLFPLPNCPRIRVDVIYDFPQPRFQCTVHKQLEK